MMPRGSVTLTGVFLAAYAMSLSANVTTMPQATLVRREVEKELLFRGQAYRRAIRSYYETDPDEPRLPQRVSELLSDTRYPGLRHLRREYENPLGGGWLLIRGVDGGISGVAPATEGKPLKQDGFPAGLEDFPGSDRYSDWRFAFLPSPVD